MPRALRQYQREMIAFMVDHPRCNLFAGMGLGKTVSVLTYLDALKLICPEDLPALILAPLRVARTVWPREAAEWAHLAGIKVVPVLGTPAERSAALACSADAYALNYENVEWLRDHLGDQWPFRTVICDESTRLKSARNVLMTSKAGKRFVRAAGGRRAAALGHPAAFNTSRWVNLSGTPASNGLTDLYGPQWFVDQGARLGNSYTAFESRWFKEGYDGFGVEPLPHAFNEITAKMRDCTLSLKAEDYFDLRQPIVATIGVELPPKARKLYSEMEDDLFIQLGPSVEVEALNAASKTSKCLQIAAGAIYTDDQKNFTEIHDAKIQALNSILEETAGAPVLVAYHYKHDLSRLQRAFPKARTLDRKGDAVEDWNNNRIRLLFAHPQSCGHGLNLAQGGNIIVFFTADWNLECHEQIIERIGPVRQAQAGLERNVFIYYIQAESTLDSAVRERLTEKSSVQDALRNALKRRQK